MSHSLKDILIGSAIGGVAGNKLAEHKEAKKNKGLNPDPPLDSIIEDYARAHGVYTRDNNLYRELLRIAEYYHDPYNE